MVILSGWFLIVEPGRLPAVCFFSGQSDRMLHRIRSSLKSDKPGPYSPVFFNNFGLVYEKGYISYTYPGFSYTYSFVLALSDQVI